MGVQVLEPAAARRLMAGMVIPAHPLALDARRRLDPRRQAALTRYYLAAGAGAVAVGVHTTQFAIRDPGVDLLAPVLGLAARTVDAADPTGRVLKVAGVLGPTDQAVREAALAAQLGYDLGLVSLGGLEALEDLELVAHVRRVTEVLPVMAFYLQPAVGGRPLGFEFWRRLADLPGVYGIKIAPFDRYATVEVVRAVAASDRRAQIALFTGNDDNWVADLLTPFRFTVHGQPVELRITGGLLGQWAVWTRRAVEILEAIHRVSAGAHAAIPQDLLALGATLTEANAALFDPAHRFRGSVAGIHEVLRRQGLLANRWCLDPQEDLSPGQLEAIDRVLAAHPELTDDDFVAQHIHEWMEASA